MSARIELTQGQFAVVDRDVVGMISGYKWGAFRKIGGSFYAASSETRNGKQERVYLHVLLMGKWPGLEVDHKNRNPLDNRRANLRLVTHRQNTMNQSKRRNSSSGHKGVTWYPQTKRWVAHIRVGGKLIHLGYHARELDAAKSYRAAAIKHFGEFASK